MSILAVYTPESQVEIFGLMVLVFGLMVLVFLLPPAALYWFVARRFYQSTKREIGFSRLRYFIWILVIGILFIGMSMNSSSALEAENVGYVGWFVTLYPLSKRIQNIGFSRWWILLGLVPVVNIWVNLLALFCPSLERKKHLSTNVRTTEVSSWKVAVKGKEQNKMDLATIKLGLLNKDLSEEDVYWDEKINEWVPLYCHPQIESENKS